MELAKMENTQLLVLGSEVMNSQVTQTTQHLSEAGAHGLLDARGWRLSKIIGASFAVLIALDS